MKLGKLGSIQDYKVYCTSEGLETDPEYEEPTFLVGYDEMITPTFFGINSDGHILEQTGERTNEDDEFYSQCRLCENNIDHLHEMYWIQAQMVTYEDVMENDKWNPLKGGCIPICPGCEEIIYRFTRELLDEHSDTLVQSRL